MSGNMNGTSIKYLQRKAKMDTYDNISNLQNMQDIQYGAMHNLQHEQGHGSAHMVQQAQHHPYYNSQNNYGYPKYLPKSNDNYTNSQNYSECININPNMEDLANDISENINTHNNNNLKSNALSSVSEEETETEIETNAQTMNNKGILSNVPKTFRDPLVILILFVILSQPYIKNLIGNYIKQINPDNTGKVSITGIVIYGVILATLFIVTKKLIKHFT